MKLLVAALCSVAVLAAACGSDSNDDTAPNTTPSTASTSTAAPQSTTTVAPASTSPAEITVATEAVTATETTPPSDSPQTDPPQTDATDPETTSGGSSPETADSTPESAARTDTPTTTQSPVGEYTEVPPPVVPTASAEVRADNDHPDGVYYATVTEGGDPPPAAGEVVFELVQLFRGEECTKHFGEDDEDSCVNDYGVDTDPTATLAVPLTDQFISVADAATQKSLEITGAELYALIHGDEPSQGAPEGYMYVGFGYFLTISGGEVTRLEQWWTP